MRTRWVAIGDRWEVHADDGLQAVPGTGMLAVAQVTSTGRVEVQYGHDFYLFDGGEWLSVDWPTLIHRLTKPGGCQVWFGTSAPDVRFRQAMDRAQEIARGWRDA